MTIAMQEPASVRSFRRFISETLPAALARAVSLTDYQAQETGPGVGRVSLTVSTPDGSQTVTCDDLPFPRADGVFARGHGRKVVVMTASSNDLATAEIKAVGEQLADEILPRLAPPPEDLALTKETLRSWLPLDRWLNAFLDGAPSSQWLDDTNPLSLAAHVRRISLTGEDASFHPSHIGRACPIETPEGPNVGRILNLASGAEVTDGRIVPVDTSPAGALGLSASMIPLLNHDDTNRAMMGANMMRQWLPLAGDPEPALVRSGNEPDDPAFWCGRSFLTAYVHWKGMNYEDAIVVSESAARRLASPDPLEVGDKISNRHGAKGVIGAILPDDEMPHLPDGRAVDLIYDSMGVYSRLNFGQVLEAALGNVADATGEPIVAPPFGGPDADELRKLLRSAGLPETGQWTLTDGKEGEPLDQPTTVGFVYWGKTVYAGRLALKCLPIDQRSGMLIGRLEHAALLAAGAHQVALDAWSARSTDIEDPGALPKELHGDLLESAPFPAPRFERLRRTLAIGGIDLSIDGDQLRYAVADPGPDDLALAVPVPHPWLEGQILTHVGAAGADRPGYEAVPDANDRLRDLRETSAPAHMREPAERKLRSTVTAFFEQLLTSDDVRLHAQALLTGKAVLAPGYDLSPDQVGIPEEMAWVLFAPLLAGRVAPAAVEERTQKARKMLGTLMEENVVIVNRAPSWEATSVTAFRPVLSDGPALRLHPICCRMFNGDYDGDQAAVWLPITRAAQQEARERLTIVGHLERDPGVVIQHLTPGLAVIYGLAYLSRSEQSRRELADTWPDGLALPDREIDRAWLANALGQALAESGAARTLESVARLTELGFAAATRSGGSLSPFAGEKLSLPPQPAADYPASWVAWCSQADDAIMSQGPGDPTLAPAVSAVRSGARGRAAHLRATVAGRGVGGVYDPEPPIRHSLREGLTPEEMWRYAAGARTGLSSLFGSQQVSLTGISRPSAAGSTLLRAMESDEPGRVFAEAAARGESDRLTDPRERLFVGLLPLEG